jgi:hypothetical protein
MPAQHPQKFTQAQCCVEKISLAFFCTPPAAPAALMVGMRGGRLALVLLLLIPAQVREPMTHSRSPHAVLRASRSQQCACSEFVQERVRAWHKCKWCSICMACMCGDVTRAQRHTRANQWQCPATCSTDFCSYSSALLPARVVLGCVGLGIASAAHQCQPQSMHAPDERALVPRTPTL